MPQLNYCVLIIAKNNYYSCSRHLKIPLDQYSLTRLLGKVSVFSMNKKLFLIRDLDEVILFWDIRGICWLWPWGQRKGPGSV